ncbi:hypothetical protein [Carbonactinospora thermoautotrophica]|uniref:hypothetical protein n=1 Tax=Carbonactinospora thermoautotrophica TaxID=1469144 RepID=UPI000AC352C4|nr:hypothetical protein [Carbonactinospora thermoautotrophica]
MIYQVGNALTRGNALGDAAERIESLGGSVEFRSVRFSKAQLDGFVTRLASDRKELESKGIHLKGWGPDIITNTVSVSLRPDTGKARESLRHAYPDIPFTFEEDPGFQTASRVADSPPYKGGDRIKFTQGAWCTAGFPVTKATGGRRYFYMVSAAHCTRSYGDVQHNGRRVGTVVSRFYADNSELDNVLITMSVGPYVWASNDYRKIQNASSGESVGSQVCVNGSYTGLTCGVKVRQTGRCETLRNQFTGQQHTTCGLVWARKSGAQVAVDGDSCGPVITFVRGGPRNGWVTVWGTVTAGSRDLSDVLYIPARFILRASSTSIYSGR